MQNLVDSKCQLNYKQCVASYSIGDKGAIIIEAKQYLSPRYSLYHHVHIKGNHINGLYLTLVDEKLVAIGIVWHDRTRCLRFHSYKGGYQRVTTMLMQTLFNSYLKLGTHVEDSHHEVVQIPRQYYDTTLCMANMKYELR